MNWGFKDFAAVGALLGGGGIALALIHESIRSRRPRVRLTSGVVLVTLPIWAHLAVGIF